MNYKFPFWSYEHFLHKIFKFFIFKRKFKKFGINTYLSPYSEVLNMQYISIGNNVFIQNGAWFLALDKYAGDKYTPVIDIGDDVYMGHFCTLSAANYIKIGKGVLIGDNVIIGDATHSYEDITKPVNSQPLTGPGKIIINDRVWIGKNVFIGTNLEIGEHSIIGANSVITKSVPPFTVVSGNPAMIIKQYSFKKKQWVKRIRKI